MALCELLSVSTICRYQRRLTHLRRGVARESLRGVGGTARATAQIDAVPGRQSQTPGGVGAFTTRQRLPLQHPPG